MKDVTLTGVKVRVYMGGVGAWTETYKDASVVIKENGLVLVKTKERESIIHISNCIIDHT